MQNSDQHRPWVVLPLKSVETSNSRLSAILSPAERRYLSLSMVSDVLDVLLGVHQLGGILVITNCNAIRRYLDDFDVQVLEENNPTNLNDAITKAIQFLAHNGVNNFFTIPADVPLLDHLEVNQLIEFSLSNDGITLVPSRDGVGTNSIMSNIPMIIRPQFGENSFAVHVQSAEQSGVSVNILKLPGLGFDVDWPSDLLRLAAMEGGSKTQEFISQLDLIYRGYDGGSLAASGSQQVRLGVVNYEH
ncbi:MAG: 2-phospho-L-lactate guanylyltransferase [Acidiferrobacteraceae bacterium]|nr:2-phospho-L-lactate guanylyltransferase [Acidiferrobacteraceae bacterium]